MALFDTKTFFELTGKGTNPVTALGTAFGMPSCLLNLTNDVLSLLPSPILRSIRGSSSNGANRADDVIKALSAKLRYLTGIIEYDTEDGVFRFVSDTSEYGVDKNEGGTLNAIAGFVGALGAAAGFAGRMYNNYLTTAAQIDSIKDCIQSYSDYLSYTGGAAAKAKAELAKLDPSKYDKLLNDTFGVSKEEIEDALDFKIRATQLTTSIDSILSSRLHNPSLEPEFTGDYASIISGTILRVEPKVATTKEEVFRLEYGPPISVNGRFLLSVDGIYFDSQTSGIVPALVELEERKVALKKESLWDLTQDPNLGGRGIPSTTEELKYYVNTILDQNIIDDSASLQPYYQKDDILINLIGQKNRRIYDLSGQIGDMVNNNQSQLLIANMRQVLLSETSHFLSKINKRKKQIELAVKIPVLYGKGSLYKVGEIPVNDFSYLEGINFLVDVQKQRSITLNQADVVGVVLPLTVKYIENINKSNTLTIDHLLINSMRFGEIITTASGVSGANISLNKSIVTDGLIAVYNYLKFSVETPSSTSYTLHNSSNLGDRLNAQLVGSSIQQVFPDGIGIPYLHSVSSGNYIKLPPRVEFQDLLYSNKGATFETWVHLPRIDNETYGFGEGYQSSGLYRLLLANENTGLQSGVSAQSDILNLMLDNGNNTVKGLVIGFTRDRRITQGLQPSNNTSDNPVEDACLFIAPTQSYDNSSVGFISKSYYMNSDCVGDAGWFSMTYPLWDTSKGVCLSSCGVEFCHIAITFDPPNNRISMYLDGTLLTTSSISNTFGINPTYQSINIPTLKKDNSFEYEVGPKLDTYFTPWIIGGGYTDGNPNGNFMGGTYGGIHSGLRGYVGSTKFYSRPLYPDEINLNFTVGRSFFKNIDMPNLMWEPIISY